MPTLSALLLLLLALALAPHTRAQLSPADAASLVAYQLSQHQDVFFKWDYGGALVFDGMFQAATTFGLHNYTSLLNTYLDTFMTDPSSLGYKILHNASVPFDSAIGDLIGLFPIAYLNRYNSGVNTSQSDLDLVVDVVNRYILAWPRHLPDGSISRNVSWPGQRGTNSFVWGDDQYMGLALAARLAVALRREDLAAFVAQQALLLGGHLETSSGLYAHGYNDANHTQSCCKWGRANGWAMLSHIEALQCVSHFESMSSELAALQQLFLRHARALLAFQGADGRWHQLIDDNTTFLETSCTAMFLSAMARGYMHGWLPDDVIPAIHKAYNALTSSCIDSDGTVEGVCEGTGIQASAQGYKTRSTDYLKSGPGGVGSVLYAAVDYHGLRSFLAERGI